MQKNVKRLFFLALAGIVLFPPSAAQASVPAVQIVAKNWAFTPSTITLHVNQSVKLVFSSSEGLHGITIPDLGVNDVINVGSSPSEVVVTPKKIGTFVAHCAVFCGAGHATMILTIKVVK